MKLGDLISFDSPLILARKAQNHSFIDANKFLLDFGGYKTLDNLIGLTDEDCPWAHHSELFVQHEKDALAGNVYTALQPTMGADGQLHWFSNYKYPVYNEESSFQYLQVIALDIKCPQFLSFINKLYHNENYDVQQYFINKNTDENLTPKELKVLFFLLRGSTAKEIAKKMKLSNRTIEQYIDSIKNKFKCSTKSQIIDYAVSKGYAHIIPTFLCE